MLHTAFSGAPKKRDYISWFVIMTASILEWADGLWARRFPSRVEEAAGRATALCSTVMLVASLALFSCVHTLHGEKWRRRFGLDASLARRAVLGCVVWLYCIARALTLVLCITTLRDLPPTALQTVEWVTLVPHI